MNKKNKTLILTLFLAVFLFSSSSSVIGQIGSNNDASMINREVKQINDDISGRKNDLKRIQQKQEEYTRAIQQKQQEKSTLKNQLALLDNRLAKSELDIELVKTDIERIKLEIQKTGLEIGNKDKEILSEKDQVANVMRLLQKRDNVDSIEMLLTNKSLSDFLTQVKYLEDVNESLDKSLKNLEKLKKDLEREEKNLTRKNDELEGMKKDLEDKRNKLESDKENKVVLIGQVGQSEQEYQRLLAAAKKEQEDAAAEIASMEKLVRAKLAALEGNKLEFNDNGMVWPVTKNVVTAYFRDPDYPFRNIFEHPGIDVRAKQGTTLKAAASGYVARVKFDGSRSYGYIMIVHGDGLSTVYGHVSAVSVKEDDYVVQGQVIGASGGMPGTPGSGNLTTGPHLHFEVRLNGIPVDPLSYLP